MAGFVTDPYAGNLGGLHGKTLTFALYTSAASPSRAGGPLTGLTGEVSTSTAPGYQRRTATGAWTGGQLRAGTSPVFDALGASDIRFLVVADAGQIVAVLTYPVPVAGVNGYKPLTDGVIAAPVWYDGVEAVSAGDGIDITGSPVVPVVEVDDTVIREGDNRLTNARTPTAHTHTAAQISDASTVGRNVLTASSQANARNAIAAVSTSDSRLTDARVPTSHTHPVTDISDSGTVGRNVVKAATAAVARNAIAAVSSTDPRLSDARVPTAHTHPAADISDATATGRAVLTASSQATARTAIGAASSAQAVPSGGATGEVLAKTSGSDYATAWVPQGGGGGGPITSADITDATTVGRTVLTASSNTAIRGHIRAVGYNAGYAREARRIRALTQAEYDGMSKNSQTLYIVVG